MALRLRWPLPVVLAWGLCWLAYLIITRLDLAAEPALLLASVPGLAMSPAGSNWWRRMVIAAGFPLALLASGMAVVPAWVWLLLLVLVLLLYPVKAWRDAPFFPTPSGALLGLPVQVALPDGAQILDAGCGLGHGLRALRAAYPQAQLHGLEWSWPLCAWCGLRCPWAQVRHGDIWGMPWGSYAMVYMFQRPESMPRATAKAGAEMAAGSWLVSLEFEVLALHPDVRLQLADGRSVWAYRIPFRERGDIAALVGNV